MDALRGCVEDLLQEAPPAPPTDSKLPAKLVDPWARGRTGGEAGLYTQKFDTEMVRLDAPITKRHPDTIAMLENNPKLVALTRALLGQSFSNSENMCSAYFRGMGHGWHQDTGTDEDLVAQMMLNRLIYFQDHSPEKGGLWYVPGSIHMGHLTQHAGEHHGPLPGEVEVIPTAGTLVMLHSRCYHRVGHNITDEPRLMFNLRAKPDSARADLARFTIWRNQTWDHGRQRPWPNGLAMDERAQAGEEAEMVPNATVDAVSSGV